MFLGTAIILSLCALIFVSYRLRARFSMGVIELIGVGAGCLSIFVSSVGAGYTSDALLSMLPILVTVSIIGGATLRDSYTGDSNENEQASLLIARSVILIVAGVYLVAMGAYFVVGSPLFALVFCAFGTAWVIQGGCRIIKRCSVGGSTHR